MPQSTVGGAYEHIGLLGVQSRRVNPLPDYSQCITAFATRRLIWTVDDSVILSFSNGEICGPVSESNSAIKF